MGHGRSSAVAGLDDDTLTLVTVLAILGEGAIGSHAAKPSDDSDILTLPRRVATGVLGEEPVQEIFGTARAELNERARLLLDEELLRFPEVIDGMGRFDEVAAQCGCTRPSSSLEAAAVTQRAPVCWPAQRAPARPAGRAHRS